MHIKMEPSWDAVLNEEFLKPYYIKLTQNVRKAYGASESIYPPLPLIFNAFTLCPFDSVNVVILGQDPYHGAGQAHGLAFSVKDSVRVPPSLQNIYKELQNDLGIPLRSEGNLTHWAKQGVFLLNTTLTVREGAPNSHMHIGWETFTDTVIEKISQNKDHVVFLLWGKNAQKKVTRIDVSKHLVLTASHPSPFSAYKGFFGCRHFSKTNTYLQKHGKVPIIW